MKKKNFMYDDDISSKKKSVGVHIHIMHVPIHQHVYLSTVV